MTRILIAAVTAILPLYALPSPAEAKTCKCDQHTADATAAGDCKLAESGTFCSINFISTGVTDQERQEFDQKKDIIDEMTGSGERGLQFDRLDDAYWLLRNFREKPAAESTIRTLALSVIPLEQIKAFAKAFIEMFGIGNPELKLMTATFNERGCFETVLNDLHILVISQSSERNRECKD